MKNNRFFQICFCVGFIGASYYSYGAVKSWLSPEGADFPKNENSQHNSSASEINQLREVQLQSLAASRQFLPANAPITTLTASVTGELVPSEAPAVSMPPLAEASPAEGAVSPTEGTDATDGSGEVAANPELQPYFPQMVADQISQNETSDQSSRSVHANNSESRDPSSLNPMAPSVINAPASAASLLAAGSVSNQTSNNQSYPFSALSGSDFQALGTAMKGSFPAGTETVSGALCQIVQPSCTYENQYSVDSRSWAMQKVLEENVNFGVQRTGQSVAFNIGFKVLTNSNVEESVSVHAVPTSVNPHREFTNSTHYRVLDFNFPNMQIHGEPVKNVHASLVYEETPSGLQLTDQSKFSFERNDVAVDATAGASYFTAEELKFSIKVEKLQ